MTKSCLILELDRETQMRWVTGKHSNVALLSLPWLRACRATAEQEDTAVPLHTHSTHGIGTSVLETAVEQPWLSAPAVPHPQMWLRSAPLADFGSHHHIPFVPLQSDMVQTLGRRNQTEFPRIQERKRDSSLPHLDTICFPEQLGRNCTNWKAYCKTQI